MCWADDAHCDLPHRQKTTTFGSLGALHGKVQQMGEHCLTRALRARALPPFGKSWLLLVRDQIACPGVPPPQKKKLF